MTSNPAVVTVTAAESNACNQRRSSLSFAHCSECANRRAATVLSPGLGHEQHGRDLVSLEWNYRCEWPVHCARGRRNLHDHSRQQQRYEPKSASALAVVSAPQPVAVSISPANASVSEGSPLQFTAAVSGMSNTAVTWAVTRGSGTITQSGLYTAPKAAESDVITATSQGDSTKSSSASITVLPPHSVALSWDASSSTAVAYYKVYRGTVSGGPYAHLTPT